MEKGEKEFWLFGGVIDESPYIFGHPIAPSQILGWGPRKKLKAPHPPSPPLPPSSKRKTQNLAQQNFKNNPSEVKNNPANLFFDLFRFFFVVLKKIPPF